MKDDLLNLIRERTNKVILAVELLKDKFGDINFIAAKNGGQIQKKGFLDAEEIVSYNLHGKGCDVDFSNEKIEFDFNFLNENHTGFNEHWLKAFLNRHQFEFKQLKKLSVENLRQMLTELEREKRIRFEKTENLYYLTDFVEIKNKSEIKKRELAVS